ncbi:MAG: filamentous hemagglutinin N-terminal domain-containing protein, partial [Candidatus Omnitrophica bacterium]|nr:filamentous hemagglutinin N-terminal domain-containing protein [Candidatus Omnitrophota bacterium]
MKKIILTTLIFILCSGTSAFALPQGQSVESGSASFNQPDTSTLTITADDRTVINFNSFDIGAQETVDFIQPNSNASVLSRVIGNMSSSILGKLFANGILFLINPNGIYIGSSANIQASAFVASTLDISTNNFINQRYIFEHDPDKIYAQILNKGTISANNVSLIASAVDNQGLILAKAGTINLASGDKITVSFDTNNCLQVEITAETSGQVISLEDGKTLDSAIANSGTLEARTVIMSAKTAANIFEYAVNQTGIVRGTGLVEENGTIRIVANKQIQVSGTLEAPQGNIKVRSDESVVINHSLDLKGDTTITSNTKDILIHGQIIQAQGTLTLNAPQGGIYNLNLPIQAKDLMLMSPTINTATQAENLTVYRNAKDMNLSACNKTGDIITLEGDGLWVTYPLSTRLTLKSDYTINTEPGVIIQANSINLLTNKFGTSTQPINVDAAFICITRLNGNIDILESQGLGSTMMIRGPPDGFGAIIYNQETNLTLEAVNGGINIAQAAYLYSNNLSLFASGDIKSFGTIKTNTLIEKGASFLVGGTFQVGYASMTNDDNAVTFNTGNYTGTYSDAVDIIINNNAIITLIGNTTFQADSDANGTCAFIMNDGSSIIGGGYNLTIYASQASTLISITGVENLTLRASKTGSNPTYTANSVLSVNNTVTITSCTLFMNSYDLIVSIIVNNGTLRGANYYV